MAGLFDNGTSFDDVSGQVFDLGGTETGLNNMTVASILMDTCYASARLKPTSEHWRGEMHRHKRKWR
jgi:hypothetical protein